jgi:CubicO group peptidase (beta-lactamase class C family)
MSRTRALLLATLLGAPACLATSDEPPSGEDLEHAPDVAALPEHDSDVSARFSARTNSLFAAVLDRREAGWASVRDLSSAEFSADFEQRRASGMMPIDVDVVEVWGQARVSAVWQDNADGRRWESWRNLSTTAFGEKWTDLRNRGYILIDQDCYTLGGTRYYSGIWIENREGLSWTSFRNASSSGYAARFNEYRAAGYLPIDIEAYPTSDGMRYAAIWVENNEGRRWAAFRDMSSAGYASKFDTYKGSYRVMDLESYRRDGGQSYAAIWVEDEHQRGWFAYRDMSEKAYGDRWNQLRDAGYRVVDFERYPTALGTEYLAVWRQTNDRPSWKHRAAVDALLEEAAAQFDIPGMSVGVAVNGAFTYVRGFGHADVLADRIAHSRTIYRLASGSKAVAGALALDLEERGLIDLARPTRAYAPSLPTHHTHLVWHTLTNRSGIGHYDENGSPFPLADFDTATAALDFFEDEPLVFAPGTDTLYSTHAYTATGAALEGALGRPIADIVRREITDRYDLPTLRVEERGDGDGERSKVYVWNDVLGNVLVPADNLSWKVLGGGLEANVHDYVRFGMKLVAGQILGAAALDKMWTPPDALSKYAYGWDTGRDSCQRVVAKNGGQLGSNSYLRIYPDAKIVIAVLTNRQDGGHSATTLGRGIGAILVGDVCP